MNVKQINEMLDALDEMYCDAERAQYSISQFEAAQDFLNSIESAQNALFSLRGTRETLDAGQAHVRSGWHDPIRSMGSMEDDCA